MVDSCKLYLVSPPAIGDLGAFVEAAKAAFDAGDVACMQLRLKAPFAPLAAQLADRARVLLHGKRRG